MMQDDTNFYYDQLRGGPGLTILVGQNGSGKSFLLRHTAENYRHHRQVIAISNSVFDRFAGQRGLEKLSFSEGRSIAQGVMKRALKLALSDNPIVLRKVGATLAYLGYLPQVGITVSGFRHERVSAIERYNEWAELFGPNADAVRSTVLRVLSEPLAEPIDVDLSGSGLKILESSGVLRLLSFEEELRRKKILWRIKLHLRKATRYETTWIDLSDASSGELTLLSCRAFLSVAAREEALILIDEPENSLHPQWQKDYFIELFDLLDFLSPCVVVATHSPIIVAGAQRRDDPPWSVFRVTDGYPTALPEPPRAVEGALVETFRTVTPQNHYLSGVLAELLGDVGSGEKEIDTAREELSELRKLCFDPRQEQLLDAVADMAGNLDGPDEF